jgi:hypothetical protein
MEHWSSTWAGSGTGKLTAVVDGDPLADGHFLLLQEVVRATRAGRFADHEEHASFPKARGAPRDSSKICHWLLGGTGFHVVVLGSGPSQTHYEAVTRKMVCLTLHLP